MYCFFSKRSTAYDSRIGDWIPAVCSADLAAILTAAIGGAVMHPLVADLDDETLRSQLLQLARRFLDLPV